MKPLSDKTLEEFEDVALLGAKQLRAFFNYSGPDEIYFQKAKLGAVAIGGYAKMRQSETGRMALEGMSERTAKRLKE